MIISLLYVGLLVMGVGAKASAPINSYKEENRPQKQLRQTYNAGDTTQEYQSQIRTDSQETEYWAWDDPTEDSNYEPGYVINQVQYKSYQTNNQNCNIEIHKYGFYEYVEPTQNDQTIKPQGTLYVLNPDFVTGRTNTPNEVYCIRIDATNKAFKTTNISLELTQLTAGTSLFDLETINYQYISGVEWQNELTIYQTTENTDNFFYNNGRQDLQDYEHEVPWFYNKFTNGNLKNTATKYNNGTAVKGRINLPNRVKIVPNKVNYIYIFSKTYATKPDDANFYNKLVNYENIFVGLANNTIDASDLTNINKNNPQNPNIYYYYVNGTYVPLENITQEVIDIPGLMWQILSMPFAFISTAFNLTLFPGTQYALNISNLVLTIFGVMVFIFILKLLIKK